MAKRALLVGINYPGTESALNGCVNDVYSIKSLLSEIYGFPEESFTLLIDTDPAYEQPTGKNIKAKLRELVAASAPGDVLFFHFSGHGTQLPGDNPAEADRTDEALVPSDLNVILDDDLRAIVKDLAEGVFFTFVADCCHSGGMLDHTQVQISGPKTGAPPLDVGSFLGALGLKPKQAKGKMGMTNRSMPVETLMSMLGDKLGQEVGPGDLRPALEQLFGEDASQKVQQYAAVASWLVAKIEGTETAQKSGCLSTFLPILQCILQLLSGGQQQQQQQSAAKPTVLPPGQKPPVEEQLADEKGILITGCQAHETSADAYLGDDPSKAFGALSNALNTVVRSHHNKNPGQPISYTTLVYTVRELLAKTGFSQNPCLEGSSGNASANFVDGTAFTA